MDIIFESKTNITAKSGGAMLNLAVSLGRCGLDISLISELGDDKVSDKIILFLKENNVKTTFVKSYANQATSIALAFLDENKKPDYSFHKAYPEKRILKLPIEITKDDTLIFGSIYSLDEKIRDQLKGFIEYAKKNGALLIYDPNIRHGHHLRDEKTLKAVIENIALADIVKGSDEDFENIFGKFDETYVLDKIKGINDDAVVVFTKGKDGASLFSDLGSFSAIAKQIKLISTVGAGDNFTAGMVYFMSKLTSKNRKPKHFSKSELREMLQMGINFSSEVCQSTDNYISPDFANSL